MFEARIRQLEDQVNRLTTQLGGVPSDAVSNGGNTPYDTVPARTGAADVPGFFPVLPSRMGGLAAPGQSMPPNPSPSDRFDSPPTLDNRKGQFRFGPGFELRTDDDEYFFQFHNLTQFEYRGYFETNHSPVHDTFAIPRQWFMFSGRITQPIGYFVSLAQGFDSTNMLDAFIDLNFDPRFNIRAGRYKTPFTYEFFVEPVQGLILPERSVFFNNFGQNRDEGVMGYGRLLGGFFDYAGGIFNGTRNGFVSNLDLKSFSSYINFRPFKDYTGSLVENLNIGGSVFTGTHNSAPAPQTLRTVVPIAGNSVLGTPFLSFNNNVIETGPFAFWDLHLAYFYRGLAVLAEWQSGFQDYALAGAATRTHLPVDAYYVEAGYLLTGETRSGLGVVKPLRPFDLRPGRGGPGAWELTGRFESMLVGSGAQVFNAGLADPNNWANSMYATDVGFNWHMTQYLKFYFVWEHDVFNQPVLQGPGRRQLTSDAVIARLQLYF